MAALNELIQKIENPELRALIQAAADKLVKQKKFGLVFEEHLPECTPLYDIPVKKGAKVALKAGKVSDFYNVLKIENGKALCLNKEKNHRGICCGGSCLRSGTWRTDLSVPEAPRFCLQCPGQRSVAYID